MRVKCRKCKQKVIVDSKHTYPYEGEDGDAHYYHQMFYREHTMPDGKACENSGKPAGDRHQISD